MKSNTWQLVVITLIALVALYVSLEIPHPDWVKNLIFWHPPDQRDIALRMGLDLQGGVQVLLTTDVPKDQEIDAALLETTRGIIENRVRTLSLTEPVVQAKGERSIIVQLPGIWDSSQVTDTIQATALVEFIDGGYNAPETGSLVETTLGGPPLVEEPTAPVTPTTPITDTPSGRVFETVLSNEDLAGIALYKTGQSDGIGAAHTLSFAFTQESKDRFTFYTAAHPGQFVCVALDKEILSCAVLPDEPITGGGGSIPTLLSDEKAHNVSTLLRYVPYGQFPVPLRVEGVEALEPSLGKVAVQRSGRAVVIGLVAVLLFLLLHYRLPGLLTSLALLVFGLFNLALCKVIPLPLILPSIAGFAIAALLALGGHLSIFERLREEMRAGRPLPKAIEASLARAWPSIRDVHLALLFISIAAWYTGATAAAESIHWMGAALSVGILTSLFVTAVATRSFVRFLFNAAQEWLSERNWLLGI